MFSIAGTSPCGYSQLFSCSDALDSQLQFVRSAALGRSIGSQHCALISRTEGATADDRPPTPRWPMASVPQRENG